jgi:hypothetical protein
MNTQIIEVNQNVTISTVLNNVSSWISPINVNFIPDVVIVRSILFSGGIDGTAPGAYIVSSNLCTQNNGILGSFTENFVTISQISYILKNPINGTHTFQILDTVKNLAQITGDICINLDFIKYKEVKEQKVY